MTTLVQSIVESFRKNESCDDSRLAQIQHSVEQGLNNFLGSLHGKVPKTRKKSSERKSSGKMNDYHLYVKCNMKRVQGVNGGAKERMTILGSEWSQLTTENKEVYKNLASSFNSYYDEHVTTETDVKRLKEDAFAHALREHNYVLPDSVSVVTTGTESVPQSTTPSVVHVTTPSVVHQSSTPSVVHQSTTPSVVHVTTPSVVTPQSSVQTTSSVVTPQSNMGTTPQSVVTPTARRSRR